jgi:hypothetical protein
MGVAAEVCQESGRTGAGMSSISFCAGEEGWHICFPGCVLIPCYPQDAYDPVKPTQSPANPKAYLQGAYLGANEAAAPCLGHPSQAVVHLTGTC